MIYNVELDKINGQVLLCFAHFVRILPVCSLLPRVVAAVFVLDCGCHSSVLLLFYLSFSGGLLLLVNLRQPAVMMILNCLVELCVLFLGIAPAAFVCSPSLLSL